MFSFVKVERKNPKSKLQNYGVKTIVEIKEATLNDALRIWEEIVKK